MQDAAEAAASSEQAPPAAASADTVALNSEAHADSTGGDATVDNSTQPDKQQKAEERGTREREEIAGREADESAAAQRVMSDERDEQEQGLSLEPSASAASAILSQQGASADPAQDAPDQTSSSKVEGAEPAATAGSAMNAPEREVDDDEGGPVASASTNDVGETAADEQAASIEHAETVAVAASESSAAPTTADDASASASAPAPAPPTVAAVSPDAASETLSSKDTANPLFSQPVLSHNVFNSLPTAKDDELASPSTLELLDGTDGATATQGAAASEDSRASALARALADAGIKQAAAAAAEGEGESTAQRESTVASEAPAATWAKDDVGGASDGAAATAAAAAAAAAAAEPPVEGAATSEQSAGAPSVDLLSTSSQTAAPSGATARGVSPGPPSSAPAPTATPPPQPSTSPAPGAAGGPKKFTSSLSVAKKFLEKAGEKSKPEQAKPAPSAASRVSPVPRLTTSAAPPAVAHPRLFAGKIASMGSGAGAQPSQSASSGAATWGRTATATTADGKLSLGVGAGAAAGAKGQPGHAGVDARGGPFDKNRPHAFAPPPGGLSAVKGRRVWGGAASDMPQGWNPSSAGDFPTAAEAANAKALRAAMLVEQTRARERDREARAQAMAARNAEILEGLDRFRGIHLDPNRSHWDEIDEDNDFLDDTIEFDDGKQYKLDDLTGLAVPPPSDSMRQEHMADHLGEGPPTSIEDMKRTEGPRQPGEPQEHFKRAEPFRDDYDRSWKPGGEPRAGPAPSQASAEAAARNLYNSRLGTFEPYTGKPAAVEQHHRVFQRESAPSPESSPASKKKEAAARPQAAAAQEPKKPPPSVWGDVKRLQPSPIPTAAPAPAGKLSEEANAPEPKVTETKAEEPAPVEPAQEDLEAMHAREMHAAAERARKRRQEEEEERRAQQERARQKALELEAKMKALAAPAAPAKGKQPAPARDEGTWRRKDEPKPEPKPETKARAEQPKGETKAERKARESEEKDGKAAEPKRILHREAEDGRQRRKSDDALRKRQPSAQAEGPPVPPVSPPQRRRAPSQSVQEPEMSKIDDVMLRIKGAMHHEEPLAAEDTRPAVPLVNLPRSAAKRAAEAAQQALSPPPVQPVPVRAPTPRITGTVSAASRPERPQSPPPAWRQYTVRGVKGTRSGYACASRMQARIYMAHLPLPIDPLSWAPPPRHAAAVSLAREDLVFPRPPKPSERRVRLPSGKLTRRVSTSTASSSQRHLRAVLNSDRAYDATTAPLALELFDDVPPHQARVVSVRSAPPSPPPALAHPRPSAKTSIETLVPGRSDDSVPLPLSAEEREAIASTAESSTPPRVTEAPSTTATPADITTGAAFSSASAISKAWPSQSKLGLTVLDPTAATVWSAPAATATGQAPRPAQADKNSLQDLGDDDLVAMPTSLAELKSEDGASNDGSAIAATSAPPVTTSGALAKDEARLQAAAAPFYSGFSTFQPAATSTMDTATSMAPSMSGDMTSGLSAMGTGMNAMGQKSHYGYDTMQRYPSPYMVSSAGYQVPMYPSYSPGPPEMPPGAYQGYVGSGYSSPASFSPGYRQTALPSLSNGMRHSRSPPVASTHVTNPALLAQSNVSLFSGYAPSPTGYGAVGGPPGPSPFKSPSSSSFDSKGVIGGGRPMRSPSHSGMSYMPSHGPPVPYQQIFMPPQQQQHPPQQPHQPQPRFGRRPPHGQW